MYILIMLWLIRLENSPHTSVVAEYTSLEACKAAGELIRQQSIKNADVKPTVVECTKKGN